MMTFARWKRCLLINFAVDVVIFGVIVWCLW